MADILYYVSSATLAFGTGLGLKGMLDPTWAGKLVRLQPENGQPEGYAEFRSTFGGMFLGLHLAALLFLIFARDGAGIIACIIIASGWAFTAIGRFVSYQLDMATRHEHVVRSLWIELVVAAAILAWPLTHVGKLFG